MTGERSFWWLKRRTAPLVKRKRASDRGHKGCAMRQGALIGTTLVMSFPNPPVAKVTGSD